MQHSRPSKIIKISDTANHRKLICVHNPCIKAVTLITPIRHINAKQVFAELRLVLQEIHATPELLSC